MGILNATPDSFSGDGVMGRPDELAQRARAFEESGADVLDIGGESTRPGHLPVTLEEEIARVVPALRAVRAATTIPISIDTRKPAVAAAAIAEGATMVNDVSGLADQLMRAVVAREGVWVVVVDGSSARGPRVADVVRARLQDRVDAAVAAGVARDRILVDPGLGFGKDWRANLTLLNDLPSLRATGRPILVGPSRKGTIGKVLGVGVSDRLAGTAALVAVSIAHGADMVRVHDVGEMSQVARMMDALVRAG